MGGATTPKREEERTQTKKKKLKMIESKDSSVVGNPRLAQYALCHIEGFKYVNYGISLQKAAQMPHHTSTLKMMTGLTKVDDISVAKVLFGTASENWNQLNRTA